MTWNYRIVLHDEDPDPDKHWYGLHECHYDPIGWTEDPTSFVCDKGEGPEAIVMALKMALVDAKARAVIVETDKETWKP